MNADRPREPSRLLIIVTPGLRRRYEHLKETFASYAWVKVILDRRAASRRAERTPDAEPTIASERRQGDRRAWGYSDDQLLLRGWAQIFTDSPKVRKTTSDDQT